MLRLDWCGREAAEFACTHWHYSRVLPSSKLLNIGVWERSKFIGVVIFGRGSTPNIGSPFGLRQTQCVELVRIALTRHETPVSRIGSIALKMLKRHSPGIRLVISYADANKGHHGGIYQAMNWVYVGVSGDAVEYFHEGKWVHNRTVTGWTKKPRNLPKRRTLPKHKYVWPFDRTMRRAVELLRKPYPERVREPAAVV